MSPDGRWMWNGTTWVPAGDGSPKLGRAGSVPRKIWLARAAIIGETFAIGCGAYVVGLIAVVVWLAGAFGRQPSVLLGALGLMVVVVLMLASVACLGFMIIKLGPVLDGWRLAIFGAQLALVPIGYFLMVVAGVLTANAGTPDNPGTDGPFADGMTGAIGLVGFAFFVGGSTVLLVLLWEATQLLLSRISHRLSPLSG